MGTQIGSFFKSKYTGQQIENMLDSAANIADQYDAASSYVVGDLVLYNNGLYVCTGATSGTFDPTKWTATSLDEILTNLGATYTDPNSDGNVVIGVDSTTGEKILRSLTFPGLTNRYYLPFAQYIRTEAANDPASASFDVEIPDAEEAPMHSTVIKGRTVATNQLANPQDGSGNGITYTVTDGVISFSGQASASTCSLTTITLTGRGGHVFYVDLTVSGSSLPSVLLREYKTDTTYSGVTSGIVTLSADTSYFQLALRSMTSGTFYSGTIIFQAIDLTACGYSAAETTDTDTFKAAFLQKRGFTLPTVLPYDEGSLANVNGEYPLTGKNLVFSKLAGRNIDTSGRITSNAGYDLFVARVQYNEQYAITSNEPVIYAFFESEPTNTGDISYNNSRTVAGANQTTFTAPITGWVAFRSVAGFEQAQCEKGSTATAYEPYYNGGTIDCSTAPLNGTGTAADEKDFATGERTTRTVQYTFDGTEAVSDHGTYASFDGLTGILGIKTQTLNAITSNGLTPLTSGVGNTPMSISFGSAVNININNDGSSVAAAMVGVTLVAELATPVTTTETPQTVETQYGYNLFAPVSGGVQSAPVDVTFFENIAGYIDKKLAEG